MCSTKIIAFAYETPAALPRNLWHQLISK